MLGLTTQANLDRRLLAKELEAHRDDCTKYRQSTSIVLEEIRAEIGGLSSSITEGLATAVADRDKQHQQNLGSLRWQRGLLIAVLLAILGFASQQVFLKVYTVAAPSEAIGKARN